ncbi:O-acetyl-ADP-ribose deacetylase [Desulfosarcina sp. BuS5]|uniref:O-acetyl-ADP-ribose deacetylase n=1 Tax=Desulfosarcina sp. BuS5 TaxID=933262 RepID=UPI000486CCD9|nr:O-acetyl-ADP-ribose deacetylase [Desulfosarcina sp. BuS5]WDN90261.1 O-acetyl-ADP-ribose deacetylase [Desulfosarcina sp. BuS5]
MNKEILDRIEIMQGDITILEVDAIVNAANNTLLGGGGVDGAIHRAAGPELLDYCRGLGGCSTGEAVITPGFKLKAGYVIHTVGPVYSGKKEDPILLALCYHNCLKLALKNNVKSIAFPAISCGVYGYPAKDACRVAVDTTCAFLKEEFSIKQVIFIQFSLDNYKTYKDYISKLI